MSYERYIPTEMELIQRAIKRAEESAYESPNLCEGKYLQYTPPKKIIVQLDENGQASSVFITHDTVR